MRYTPIERQAIVSALDKNTVTNAARALRTSRRTLQSRMRDYEIAPGQAGRPRRQLVGGSVGHGGLLVTAAAIVGVLGFAAWLYKWKSEAKNVKPKLAGLDLLGC
jgi:Bacterial regulatory protein, Fis family